MELSVKDIASQIGAEGEAVTVLGRKFSVSDKGLGEYNAIKTRAAQRVLTNFRRSTGLPVKLAKGEVKK